MTATPSTKVERRRESKSRASARLVATNIPLQTRHANSKVGIASAHSRRQRATKAVAVVRQKHGGLETPAYGDRRLERRGRVAGRPDDKYRRRSMPPYGAQWRRRYGPERAG